MFVKRGLVFVKHGSLWFYRLATGMVLVAGALFVAGVLALRYALLPNVDGFRPAIAGAVSEAIGQPVEIARLEGSWRGYRPELTLHGLRVSEPGGQLALELQRFEAVLSWTALFFGKLSFHSIELEGAALEVRRDAQARIWVSGTAIKPAAGQEKGFLDWLLAQRQVVIRHARVTWTDALRSAGPLVIRDVALRLDNDGPAHRFGMTGVPPPELAAPLTLRGEFAGEAGERGAWRGRVYVAVERADLARLQEWFPAPLRLESGQGSIQLWLDVHSGRVVAATAESVLADVRTRLAPELAPLALRRFAARLSWQEDAAQTRLAAEQITFTTEDDITLPAARIELRRRGTQSELHLQGLELAPVVALAERLPLDARIRERLQATAPSGRINSAKLAWEGAWDASRPYAVQADLEALRWRADGVLPGLSGFAAHLAVNERGGVASLRANAGTLALPRVFEEPIPLDYLNAEVDWSLRDGQVVVSVRNAAFVNDHAAGNISGTYWSEPGAKGTVDVSGSLVRADANAVWRYIPRRAPGTQRWLQRALVTGTADEVRLRLKGPLDRFPFADGKSGLFEVVSKVRDITLAFDERWPAVEGASGVVAFRGAQMDIQSSAGHMLGLQTSGVRARIPMLGDRDERLLLEGEAHGSLGEFLRLIAESPVSEYTGRFTEHMRAAEGEGKLRLSLELPLRRIAEAKVSGTLEIDAREVIVDPRIPALSDVAAAVTFTEAGASVHEGRARIYGAPLHFDLSAQRGGVATVVAAGLIDARGLQRAHPGPLTGALDGAAEWKATLTLRDRVALLRASSTLAGMALRLPAPFAKPAAASLPFAVELKEGSGGGQQLFASLGQIATAQLLFDGGALRAGEVRFGGQAGIPRRSGLTLTGRLDEVNIDAWRQWAGAPAPSQGPGLSAVDLSVGALSVAGRRFAARRLQGERDARGWRFAVEGPDVSGTLAWESSSESRITGRFAALRVPEGTTALQPSAVDDSPPRSLPGLDIVADSFTFEGKPLGRLELLALAQGDAWQLQRLEVSNPDGRLSASGRWSLGAMPETTLDVRIEAQDVGGLLTRLGYAESIRGGNGALSGRVSWAGAPHRLDLPSLDGQLRLEAAKGRFARLDPGMGKLLGLLSLQTLPRRLSLDFRDVFSAGFSFDRISADVVLTRGVARTENFRMEGPAARVAMRGAVDLAAETQDLRLRVLPQLSTGVAIAGAMVNPAVGIATLLAQKALGDPVEQLAAAEYHVTGTWAAPDVERVIAKGANGTPRR
ncbi:MAG TPA: YhdP family protein [Burkholderiales bacterium]|nr:YhdP family protein [Burkholderiales bacterium]